MNQKRNECDNQIGLDFVLKIHWQEAAAFSHCEIVWIV